MTNFRMFKKQISHMKSSGFSDSEISKRINLPITIVKMLQKGKRF